MAISQKIQVRQNQTLVMTPQLQQSIQLLRMSNLEVTEFIKAEAERNPLIEIREPAGSFTPPQTGGSASADSSDRLEDRHVSLLDHVTSQVSAMKLEPSTAQCAMIIAGELEDDGYLRTPLREIADAYQTALRQVELALSAVQACEPAGVGARSLKECLALQLREKDRLDPAMQLLIDNLHLISGNNRSAISEICGVGSEDVGEMLSELRDLNPKPGLKFQSLDIRYMSHDVRVSRNHEGSLMVELNPDTLPRVLASNEYSTILGHCDKKTRSFLSECHENARWLTRTLEQRARTILRVSTEIVTQQEKFFSEGHIGMRPLTQASVAAKLGIHESTVSRAVSEKSLSCDQGLYRLQFFFCSAIGSTDNGGEFGAHSVQCRIKMLVDNEKPGKILSDNSIAALLLSEGIDIARRTVAKYREGMEIPSSVQRKRIKTGRQ